jgi:hypothetical protein
MEGRRAYEAIFDGLNLDGTRVEVGRMHGGYIDAGGG